MSNKVQFVEITKVKFDALLAGELEGYTFDENALYFVSDTGQLYKGEDLYSGTTAVSKDDSVEVTVASNINFVGKGFTVSQDKTDPTKINVSMPFNLAKMTANYYGVNKTTGPGNTDASVGNASTTSRYVALPGDGTYLLDSSWTTTTTRSVLGKSVTSISYTTTEEFSIENEETYFVITLTKGDGTTVVEQTAVLTGNGTYSTTNCSVVISGWTADFIGYKAKAVVTINVANMLGGAGKFDIKISHMIGSTAYSKEQKNLFYDDNPEAGSVGSGAIALNNTSNTKWLSGVEYLTTNTTVDVTLSNITGVFNKSFVDSVGTIKTNCTADISYTASDVATAAGLTLATAKNNTTAATLTKSGIKVSASKYLTSIQFTSATCGNGWNTNTNSTASSVSLTKAIDTYAAASTSLAEQFQDEAYRLKSDLSTAWNSESTLGDSDLQVGKGTWLFPKDTTKSQSYIRNFAPSDSSTTSTSNFTFTLSGTGLTEANLAARNFDLEISLDGVNWFTFSKDKEDVLVDGSGIREYKDSAKLSGTSGTLRGSFTAGMNTGATSGKGGKISGYGIYARITIKGTGIELNSISVAMI